MKLEEAISLKAEIDQMPFWTSHVVVRDLGKGFNVQRDYGIHLVYQNPLTNVYITEPMVVGTREAWERLKANIEPVRNKRQQRER